MPLLRRRQVWVGAGLLVAAAAGVAVYAFPPWPSFLNWVFDLMAVAVTFLGGLAIISQFVLPVQTNRERRKVFDHLMTFVTGGAGPILFVKDGKLVGGKEELRRYGNGVALNDPVSALVLEVAAAHRWGSPSSEPANAGRSRTPQTNKQGPELVRAAGPGIVFIRPGERIVATLDLRRQSRGVLVEALTRDGIECSAYVSVTFGLDPDPDRRGPPSPTAAQPAERVERNQPAYPFHPSSAFRAVYGVARGDKQPLQWTDLPLVVAAERFRDVLSECRLDDLFPPTKPGVYPFADFQGRVNRAVKEAPVLRERGLIVYSVGIADLKLPREVLNQRVRSWQARWKKAAIQQEAAAQTHAIRTESRWQTQAQQAIFKDVQSLMGATDDPVARRALSLMLLKALQRAAHDPSTRQRLPAEALRALDTLKEVLK